MKLTISGLCEALGCDTHLIEAINGKDYLRLEINQVVIDSRKVGAGDVFFAFNGERVNGEAYAGAAIAAGAAAVVVSKNYVGQAHGKIFQVEDVQWALQELAKYYTQKLQVPIIGISGSVGKTSTKDLLAHVLSSQLKVFKTQGNYNNELGVPLMLLALDDQYDIAVLEMGMNHPGELARLVEIARPGTAVLTNIGTAHIEFFGSREGIFKAKMELASKLGPGEYLILNGLDDLLSGVYDRHSLSEAAYSCVAVGRPGDTLWAEAIQVDAQGTRFELNRQVEGKALAPVLLQLPLWGRHHVVNALLSLAVVERLGLSMDLAIEALASAPSTPMRFERIVQGDRIWINDAYNASLDSILASVEALTAIEPEHSWAILGDVFECGEQSESIHKSIGEGLNRHRLEGVVFIGKAMYHAHRVYHGPSVYFESFEEAKPALRSQIPVKACILVKASRGMQLENVITFFLECDTCTRV